MDDKKEKTAPIVSVGADTEQQFSKYSKDIITEDDENSNTFDDFRLEMIRAMDPSYLKTVSMSELYDTVFQNSRMAAIGTGSLDFLTKQHLIASLNL